VLRFFRACLSICFQQHARSFLSWLSFHSRSSLFLTTCRLFCQNTGGWVPVRSYRYKSATCELFPETVEGMRLCEKAALPRQLSHFEFRISIFRATFPVSDFAMMLNPEGIHP
jgi:hypothetical protein